MNGGWAASYAEGPGLYDLTFHFMNQNISFENGKPIQIDLGGPTPLVENQWNHFAIVSDGQSVVVMVNGRIRRYDRAVRIFDRYGYYAIGGYRGHINGVLDSAVDALRISDTARSIEAIKTAYDRARPTK